MPSTPSASPVASSGDEDDASALIAPGEGGEGGEGENVVPIPSAAQIIAFFRKVMDGGVTPEQLKCLGATCSASGRTTCPMVNRRRRRRMKKAAASPPLSPCWLMLFSTMVQAGMTQDIIDLRRKYTQKEILTKEDETAPVQVTPEPGGRGVHPGVLLGEQAGARLGPPVVPPQRPPEPMEDGEDGKGEERAAEGAGGEAKDSPAEEARDIVLCKSHVPSRSEIERGVARTRSSSTA